MELLLSAFSLAVLCRSEYPLVARLMAAYCA